MASAEQLEDNGQYELAYEEYKKQYANNPKNTHVLERLGHIANILNNKEDAEKFYTELVRIDASNLMAYEQLMDICSQTNKYKYYVCRGEIHVLQGQLEHAINDYKKAVERTDNETERDNARYILATLYENSGKNNQAIDEYLKLIDTHYENDNIYINLANIYSSEGILESAIDTLNKAKELGFNSVNENLAKLYIKADEPQKALELTSDELTKIRCYMDMGDNEKALSIMQDIKDKYSKNAKYHSLMAQYYYQTNDFENAFKEVEEHAKLDANSPVTYQMRALIYEKQGNDFLSHVNWAKFHYARGNKDIGMNEYMIAYQINNSDIELVTTIADILDIEDKNHSIEFYEQLLTLNPNSKRALQKLAEFRVRIGDYNEAMDYIEKLKSIDEKNPYVKDNYDKIKDKIENGSGFFDSIMNFFRGK